jgi:hypothetical protein
MVILHIQLKILINQVIKKLVLFNFYKNPSYVFTEHLCLSITNAIYVKNDCKIRIIGII